MQSLRLILLRSVGVRTNLGDMFGRLIPLRPEPVGKFVDFYIPPEQKWRGANFLRFGSEQNFPTTLTPNIRLPSELSNYIDEE